MGRRSQEQSDASHRRALEYIRLCHPQRVDEWLAYHAKWCGFVPSEEITDGQA